jgi:hypothetical protein
MLTVAHDRHGALLDLHWSEDSGWSPHAERMLLDIEAMVVRAGTR